MTLGKEETQNTHKVLLLKVVNLKSLEK